MNYEPDNRWQDHASSDSVSSSESSSYEDCHEELFQEYKAANTKAGIKKTGIRAFEDRQDQPVNFNKNIFSTQCDKDNYTPLLNEEKQAAKFYDNAIVKQRDRKLVDVPIVDTSGVIVEENENLAQNGHKLDEDGPAEVEKVSSSADRPDAVKDSALVKENCMCQVSAGLNDQNVQGDDNNQMIPDDYPQEESLETGSVQTAERNRHASKVYVIGNSYGHILFLRYLILRNV
ncbi:unnamed protein product [Clavelina lepadiformis]|uniref:Uncharacterized protein n=1 Tax=Clavelina lepadiformis TaxID=159417 RepID=A0ABP0GV50_CLALP